MFKCLECGHVFLEPKIWREERGEFWGAPCYESMAGCPRCNEAFSEAYRCKVCGDYFLEEEMHGEVCCECIRDNSDFDSCYAVGENNQKEIQINGFLSYFFTSSEIEHILKSILLENKKIDCSEYINEDIVWFAEQLAKKKEGKYE